MGLADDGKLIRIRKSTQILVFDEINKSNGSVAFCLIGLIKLIA